MTAYVPVVGYTYLVNGFTATLDVTTESMDLGKYYQFVFRAKNSLGYSDYSPVVSVGIADVPT